MDQGKSLFLLDCMNVCENHNMKKSVCKHECMSSLSCFIYILSLKRIKNNN